MTAAEAERIKAALLVESSHLRRKGPSTHSLTCDCFFLKALDAVIAGEAKEKEMRDIGKAFFPELRKREGHETT